MITLFGSCRLGDIKNKNNINEETSFIHSTKEAIQLIKFLKGELTFDDPYNRLCFRTGVMQNRSIQFSQERKNQFDSSDICVVEICSRKKYVHNGHYLHHLCVDPRFKEYNTNTPRNILSEYKIEHQSDQEIIDDVYTIKNLIEGKKLILACHYNSKMNGKFIKSRVDLIELVCQIAEQCKLDLINPNEALDGISQNDVMQDTLGHYTALGHKMMADYTSKFL